MPRIDFYILPTGDENERLAFCCRLIEKAYKQNHRIYIHAETEVQAYELDELLWTYREDSFLPHNLYGEGPEPPPPIQVGFQSVPEKHKDILINLSATVPEFYRNMNRVIELVNQNPEIQTVSRHHYRFYRSAQHEINTHKLQSIEV